MRTGTEIILETAGYEIITADSAIKLLTRLEATGRIPDVLISDYRLRYGKTRDMAIADVNKKLQVDVPAMIITGDTSPGRIHELTQTGYLLLHKPLEPAGLLTAVEEIIGKHDLSSNNSQRSAAS